MRNLTLRQKLLFSQIILVVFFVCASFPIVEKTVKNMVFKSLDLNTQDLINYLVTAESEEKMIQKLKEPQPLTFYRISLYDSSGNLLYDAMLSKQAKDNFVPYYPPTKEAILKVLKEGKEFSIEESKIHKKKSIYFINTFSFKGKIYILRTAITYQHIDYLEKDFNAWIITFSILTWLFFSALTWLILSRLHRPIHQIINAIKPYQVGKQEEIPEIVIGKELSDDNELKKLALTLNSLSSRVREQLHTLKMERNEKETILDSLEEGVFSIDNEFTLRYINTTAAKMLNVDKKSVKHQPFAKVKKTYHSSLMSVCAKVIEECQKEHRSVRESLVLQTPRKVYLDVIGVPKVESIGAIVVIQDTSNHHKILEIGKDFIANASHELRTPITIIRGFAETLQDITDLPKATLIDVTEKIMRNCQRMDSLIKNLLLLSDIENMPATRFRDAELVTLIEDSAEMAKNVYRDAHITISKEPDSITAFIDPDLFELAVINLLHNAAKYSHPPAEILVKIKKEASKAIISISDKGIGIPTQEIDHIFERFYTVDKAHSRKLGGAGLGLSIVKTIIEKLGGTIKVESVVGKGSTFIITLPLHHSQ